jgi:H+/Cl- antiporter ClcA
MIFVLQRQNSSVAYKWESILIYVMLAVGFGLMGLLIMWRITFEQKAN